MPHMEPTKVMMLGRVGQQRFQPRLRTSFINPPRTTPIEPQNLLRQSLLGGLGRTGQLFARLGQVGEELVTGPTEDIVNQQLERGLSPGGQTVPTQPAPIMSNGAAQMPNGTSIAVDFNEDGQPVDVLSASGSFQVPIGGRQVQVNTAAAIGYAALSMVGGMVSAYHGYRRDRGSLGSTLGWFVLGSAFPLITVPVALLQKPGFAKPKRR